VFVCVHGLPGFFLLFRAHPLRFSRKPKASQLHSDLSHLEGVGASCFLSFAFRAQVDLNARDKGCRFPGCANTRYIDAHHVEHWANGGETKPSNLVSLCRFHHHAVHEGGIRIEMLDDGALRFRKPNGAAVDSVAPGFTQPLGDWRQLPEGTLVNKWRGERMDLGLAVDVLLQQARRAKDVPAGTSRL
jgi:hypothetical protein